MLATILTVVASPFMRLALMLSPVGSILSFVWAFINNPICRVVLYVALAVGLYAVGDLRGRIKEHEFMVAQNKQETARAVAEANAARDAADKKFVGGKFNNRPSVLPGRVRHGSDGYSRD